MKTLRKPRRLAEGSKLSLIAPASPFEKARLEVGKKILRKLGFVPVVGKAAHRREGFLAGADDEQRAEALIEAFIDFETDGVFCIRGGYGSTRLLVHLDEYEVLDNPKPFVGFSDCTVLLNNFAEANGFVTLHGPVVTQLGDLTPAALAWFKKILTEDTEDAKVPLGKLTTLESGKAVGILRGGNLAILASLVGTPDLPDLSDAILFLEDTAEPAYRLDRMWRQLLLSGALEGVKGVILGSFADCTPTGKKAYSALWTMQEAVKELGIPAVSGASFGHLPENIAIPVGVRAELDAKRGILTLAETAFS